MWELHLEGSKEECKKELEKFLDENASMRFAKEYIGKLVADSSLKATFTVDAKGEESSNADKGKLLVKVVWDQEVATPKPSPPTVPPTTPAAKATVPPNTITFPTEPPPGLKSVVPLTTAEGEEVSTSGNEGTEGSGPSN